MKTFLFVVVITSTLLTPIFLIVRHLAKDETARLQRALREERESWDRFKRVVDKDMEHLHSRGFFCKDRSTEQK